MIAQVSLGTASIFDVFHNEVRFFINEYIFLLILCDIALELIKILGLVLTVFSGL